MAGLLRQSTFRPDWAEANFAWTIEDFTKVVHLANAQPEKKVDLKDAPLGIYGKHVYSPEFRDSAGGRWNMRLDPMCSYWNEVDLKTIGITFGSSGGTSRPQGYYTLFSPGPLGWTVVSQQGQTVDGKWVLNGDSRVILTTAEVVENNIFSIRCVLQVYCGMAESVIYLPGKYGDECILLRPSEDDELHIDYTEAVGVPCRADILVAKIPVVRPLFKKDKAAGYYVVSVPYTDLLTLKHLVEYMKTNRCSLLGKEPNDKNLKRFLDEDVELSNLLNTARRLEFKGLVEACEAAMQRSPP